MKDIRYTASATRELAALAAAVRTRIVAKIHAYAATGAGNVRKLTGMDGARLRVGDWRVLFTEDETAIDVYAVGHRSSIYD